MKICLINVPNTYELVGNDPVIIKDQQGLYPPLGILYIAACLHKEGYDVKVIDAQVDDLSHAEVAEQVRMFNPGMVGITAMTFTLVDCKKVVQEIRKICKTTIVIGGPHTAIYPDECFEPEGLDADYVVVGEGEKTLVRLAQDIEMGKAKDKIYRQLTFIEDLNELPFPARELTPISKYYSVLSEDTPTTTAFSSRGCPFCLTGDTLINTIDGDIPIKDLVGKEKVAVYTYDPKTKDLFITDAINIRMVWKNKPVVRVTFDDDTYIDCTPEHRFLTFKNGNQFVDLQEFETEAKDLQIGMSVRAFREELSGKIGNQYMNVTWARRSRNKKSRLIMEYQLGRKLTKKEIVHHKNHNKLDDRVENLEYIPSFKSHMAEHPEVSQRMKDNNPSKSHLKSVKEKLRLAITGMKRSDETKRRMSISAINREKRKRELQVNHKVVSVMPLPDNQDVYCMEVPSTHWFFANKVLVANSCAYCDRPALGKGFRAMDATRVSDELEWCVAHGIKEVFFYDDTFSVSMKRVNEICNQIKIRKIKIKWDVRTRVNVVNEDLLKNMKEAGCERIHFGVETGNPRVVKELQKGTSIKQVEQAFDLCKKYKIKTLAYFMMGNPTETMDDVKDTLAVSRRIKPDFMQMTILSPFPATQIYLRALQEGVVEGDPWRDYAKRIHNSFRPPLWDSIYSRNELEQHLRWFYGKFYLQPSFVIDRIKEVRNFGQFKRYASAGVSLLKMTLKPESKIIDSWRTRKELEPDYKMEQETAVAVN